MVSSFTSAVFSSSHLARDSSHLARWRLSSAANVTRSCSSSAARSAGARQTLRQLRHLLGQSLLISKKPIGEVEVPLGRRVVRRALFRELRRRVRGRAIVRHAKFRLEFRHRRRPRRAKSDLSDSIRARTPSYTPVAVASAPAAGPT